MILLATPQAIAAWTWATVVGCAIAAGVYGSRRLKGLIVREYFESVVVTCGTLDLVKQSVSAVVGAALTAAGARSSQTIVRGSIMSTQTDASCQ